MIDIALDKPTSKFLSEYPFKIALTHYPCNWKMASHRHPCSSISIVMKGSCLEETTKGSAIGTACSLVIKPREIKHENRFGPNGATILNIQGNENDICKLSSNEILGNWHWIHTGYVNDEIKALFHAIVNRGTCDEYISGSVYELIAALNKCDSTPGKIPFWILRVKDIIQSNPDHPHRVEKLAEEVGTHPVYLTRIFKKYFQKTIIDYLKCVRVQYAIDKMASSNQSLTEIAGNSGFTDQSHFGRIFKDQFQTTPNKFRKMIREID